MSDLRQLEERLGYSFQNLTLLEQALCHRSLQISNNERLEFLGDAVLGLIAADRLYREYSRAKEGELSRFRTALVSGENLAVLAIHFGLDRLLQFVPTDLNRSELVTRHRTLLADAMEAVIGAIYLDSSWERVYHLVIGWLHDRLTNLEQFGIKDAKTVLQEWLQNRHHQLPEYWIIDTRGPEHSKWFKVGCRVAVVEQFFLGESSSKRFAEQLAAQSALEVIRRLESQGDI